MSSIFTLEFLLTSVLTAFFINIVSSFAFRKFTEKSTGFRHRALAKLQNEYTTVAKLHSDQLQLQCFAFRGFGISLAMMLISSGVFLVPTVVSTQITLLKGDHPRTQLSPQSCVRPAQDAPSDLIAKYEAVRNECEEYAKKSAAYHERQEYIEKTAKWMVIVGMWMAVLLGAVSLYFAVRLYRYFGLVQHYEEYESSVKQLLRQSATSTANPQTPQV